MTPFSSLAVALHQIGAVQFGEFQLKSGLKSNIYINLRKIIAYPTLLKQIATLIWSKIDRVSFDLVCGIPYTALPIATALSLEHNIPMVIRRKEKKTYGTKQLIEGVFQAGQSCLIIEDIITTGSSVLETTADLEAANLKIHDVVVLVDRGQGGLQTLTQRYRVHVIFTLSQMLQMLLQAHVLNATEQPIVETFLSSRG